MAVQTPGFIAATWLEVGGDPAKQVYATCIALAESGGDPEAISPTGDYGLWQINHVHSADPINQWPYILEPDVNARYAIAISGNGQNWAPWSTAYADGARSGYLTYLGAPQPGSAAANYIPLVEVALGAGVPNPPITPPPPAPPPAATTDDPMQDAWAMVRDWTQYAGPALVNRLNNAASYARGGS